MPRIPIYTGPTGFVAVKDAVKKQGFICPFTTKIFEHKSEYVSHLITRRSYLHGRIRHAKHHKKILEFNNVETFEELIKWVENNPTIFFDNSQIRVQGKPDICKEDERNAFEIRILNLELDWQDSVSNTHSCPRNGKTNWSVNKNLPTGYPGWSGRIVYSQTRIRGYGSEAFRGTGINTGSGGGSEKYTYDIKLFAADWPNLAKAVSFAKLKNERIPRFSFNRNAK